MLGDDNDPKEKWLTFVEGEASKAREVRGGFLEEGADTGAKGSMSLRKVGGAGNSIQKHLAAVQRH